jgi:ABC-type glycerol-3-phosphate transport system substrate-binding protein
MASDTRGGPEHLTERQKKWFASVREGLERDTGKSLEDWVAVAKTCPETKPRAQLGWFKGHHGLGQNRASYVLSVAFPSDRATWDNPDDARAALWTDPAAIAILKALEAAVADFDGMVTGQRKTYSAWSRAFQFAAAKPVKGGMAVMGLALTPDTSPRLLEPKNESWSERLKAKLPLGSPADVDEEVRALLRMAFERS